MAQIIFWIVVSIVFILVLFLIIIFNLLTKKKTLVEEGFSMMDVYLVKRFELLPSLVKVVQAYAKHEKETFESVTKLRTMNYNAMTDSEKIDFNSELTTTINKLIVMKESYPTLSADKMFLNLSDQLYKINEDIVQARKYYNAVVREFNIAIKIFPNNIIARIFKFQAAKMFEANLTEKNEIEVNI